MRIILYDENEYYDSCGRCCDCCCEGPHGPRGFCDATGSIDPAGSTGIGITGPTGATGVTGSTEATGPVGIGPIGPIEAVENTGSTGPTDLEGSGADCLCIQQMINILLRIIQLYPNDTIVVTMESDNNTNGRADSLLPSSDHGLLQLTNVQGVLQEAMSICHITPVRITNAVYNEVTTYLSVPVPAPTGCSAVCENAVHSYLLVGTPGVDISAGGQTVEQGTVIRNEFAMMVLVGPNSSDLTFTSAHKTEIIMRQKEQEGDRNPSLFGSVPLFPSWFLFKQNPFQS